MEDISRMPPVSSINGAAHLHDFQLIGELNSGSVAKEDMFRGKVQFSVPYSLAEHAMDPEESASAARESAGSSLTRHWCV